MSFSAVLPAAGGRQYFSTHKMAEKITDYLTLPLYVSLARSVAQLHPTNFLTQFALILLYRIVACRAFSLKLSPSGTSCLLLSYFLRLYLTFRLSLRLHLSRNCSAALAQSASFQFSCFRLFMNLCNVSIFFSAFSSFSTFLFHSPGRSRKAPE